MCKVTHCVQSYTLSVKLHTEYKSSFTFIMKNSPQLKFFTPTSWLTNMRYAAMLDWLGQRRPDPTSVQKVSRNMKNNTIPWSRDFVFLAVSRHFKGFCQFFLFLDTFRHSRRHWMTDAKVSPNNRKVGPRNMKATKCFDAKKRHWRGAPNDLLDV